VIFVGTRPTPLQQKAFDLLGIAAQPAMRIQNSDLSTANRV
jgi:hypothetical protein